MKLIQYIDDSYYARVAILFDDNTYAVTSVISGNRSKDDILKDAYILLRNVDRVRFEGNHSDYEDLVLPAPKENFMEVNFYDLTGKAYDQYGDEIFKDITFEVVGTDKAKIENGKLVTGEVQEETSFFIVAKCGTLEERQERTLYPQLEEPTPQPDMTATLVKEVANLKIDSIKDKQINKSLGQEVANLKIKLMQIEGGK